MTARHDEESVKRATEVLVAFANVIRDATKNVGGIPDGHLYAALMGHMDLDTYSAMRDKLVELNLITKNNHFLVWKGK